MKFKLLLVDDDLENLKITKRWLESSGYEVATADCGKKGIQKIQNAKKDFALVLMDYLLPDMTGAEAIKAIKMIKPDQQIIGYSIDDTKLVLKETLQAGAVDFIDKNSDPDHLLSAIEERCAKFQTLYRCIEPTDLNNERAKMILGAGMVGVSDALYHLTLEIEKVAPTSATVLIFGESGTGKELVAQALHNFSNNSQGPFIAINIAATPANLIDSALFGHKKGAFTDASQDREGLFQAADGGTIFLDEIGDLSLNLQVRLLRVLQEREVTPVGSNRPIKVNTRIVSATNKNLIEMVRNGLFREDLYYRLCPVVLETTPLRNRVDDIEPLIAHFTEVVCRRNRINKRFHTRCLEVLKRYLWRGNVRELSAVVERHLIRSDLSTIGVDQLEPYLFKTNTNELIQTMAEFDTHLDQQKKAFVTKVLEQSKTKADAARALKIAPNQLHYYLLKYGIGHDREFKQLGS